MSEWKKAKLGEITESCLGKMLDAAKNRGEYKPYLANLNVRWGCFDTDNLSLMKFEEDEDERYGIKYGDLIICEGGEPGRCAIWKEEIPDMKIQKALHRVRPKKGLVDNFYLFYWFLLAGKRNLIDQYCTGATIKHLPGQKLKEVVVDLPPLATQHYIATILSRYDSLIENYQKQIKLLEEAAQRLYKEWFVDLHFPGHENTKIVDGVPEGWEKKTVGDIAKIKSGYAFKSKDWQSTGCPVVKIKDITGTFVNSELLDCVSFDIASKAKQYLLNSGDLVIAMTGATIGKIGIIVENGLYTNQRVGKFFLNESDLPFVYCLFKQESSLKYIIQISSASSAQPNISGKQLESLSFVYDKELYKKYNIECIPLFKQMISLQSQIRLLTEARDRLLPKLMSGEIAV